MKKKQIINLIVSGLASVFGLAAMVTQLVADKDDREDLYEDLEERYGLKKKDDELYFLVPPEDVGSEEE